MSRTLCGNLTGRAAQIDRADNLEFRIAPLNLDHEYDLVRSKLLATLGREKLNEWMDAQPAWMRRKDVFAEMKKVLDAEQSIALDELAENPDIPDALLCNHFMTSL